MTLEQTIPSWERSQFNSGGEDAVLFFAVLGKFQQPFEMVGPYYRTETVPAELTIALHERDSDPATMDSFLQGYMGKHLQRENPILFEQVKNAPECITMLGTFKDPSNLNYLRDTVGLITALLDGGGIAVYDPWRISWWNKEEWNDQIFIPNPPLARNHAIILLSEEEDNPEKLWIHSRGMRKFGRPDLSVRNVPPGYSEAVSQLCNRFIDNLAAGQIVPEGQLVRMGDLPPVLQCHHKGSLQDPDFNNFYIEMIFPGEGTF